MCCLARCLLGTDALLRHGCWPACLPCQSHWAACANACCPYFPGLRRAHLCSCCDQQSITMSSFCHGASLLAAVHYNEQLLPRRIASCIKLSVSGLNALLQFEPEANMLSDTSSGIQVESGQPCQCYRLCVCAGDVRTIWPQHKEMGQAAGHEDPASGPELDGGLGPPAGCSPPPRWQPGSGRTGQAAKGQAPASPQASSAPFCDHAPVSNLEPRSALLSCKETCLHNLSRQCRMAFACTVVCVAAATVHGAIMLPYLD